MIVRMTIGGVERKVDTDVYYDLSTPIRNGSENVNAYYINDPSFEPFAAGGFIGSVEQGGACNCEDITFNAHGNGTHTECVGHISKERITINQSHKTFHCIAQVISVTPNQLDNGDSIIEEGILDAIELKEIDALIIRTLPNTSDKLTRHYSGTNPTYLSPSLTARIGKAEITHLIVDLPSVDREEDGGALLAHHAYWSYPENPRMHATITELAFIPDEIEDGQYLLNLQIASFESDASPSKPLLFPFL